MAIYEDDDIKRVEQKGVGDERYQRDSQTHKSKTNWQRHG